MTEKREVEFKLLEQKLENQTVKAFVVHKVRLGDFMTESDSFTPLYNKKQAAELIKRAKEGFLYGRPLAFDKVNILKRLLHWLNFVKRYRIKQMLKEHKELQKLFNDMSGTDDYN